MERPTRYLTPQEVLFIHARLIATTGGETGVRDVGLLASAVARPQATFEGRELYPDLFAKTAALMDSLVRNHPFVDGNKRTAITAAGLFLRQNGRRLQTSNEVVESFTLQIATRPPPLEEMAAWFRQHSVAADAK